MRIKRMYEEAQIEIAFPMRDVNIRNVEDLVLLPRADEDAAERESFGPSEVRSPGR